MLKYLTLFLLIMSCSTVNNSNNDRLDTPLSKIMITASSVPADVDEIIGVLTNSISDSITGYFTISNDSAFCLFENIPVGDWNLNVSAFYNNELTYQGSAVVEVVEDVITYISVYMERVQNTGLIHIDLTWEGSNYQIFQYNFDDGDLSGWYGPANAEIIEGQMHISSIPGYENHSFKYHTIAPFSSPHFTSGSITVDILPQAGKYSFGAKGETISSDGVRYGTYVHFKHDSVFVVQNTDYVESLEFTNFTYVPNNWYNLRFQFDNDLGEKGKFDFWITPMTNADSEIYLGQFDFTAPYGRLEGVNQFVLAVGDPDGSSIMEGIFDNIEFRVE